MRRLLLSALALTLATGASAQSPQSEDQKTLYAIGVLIGKQLDVFGLSPAEFAMVKQGLDDNAAGKKLAVEPEAYQPKINQLAQARMKITAEKQKEKSKAFLDQAAKEKGAQKSPSGLVYVPIHEGKGAQPKPTDTVKVHYTGTLTDGKVFDSSVKRGQPAEFPLNQVIKCWTEGVGKMKVGGKAKLVCPSAIAYGDEGRPPTIPGGATLVFEVELLDIKK
ncbi:FKBP-type peptidyl-prolyl cis-trans isomerase [Anaeromyxobacter diazotrophicus]|uniref:Peptidyl-prolyl cis-trans isomerase n=1 Tax=Anaeromyxobacter diazotrophicus TaxID=2590199 RepID=A0A7I9VIL7_9BACT|nr:FKBP-type peptidyl-prolyl cis-trans isomerase [Anaeromyxobacter diazotrophicus]GEJ55867.1 peptidyl-prolyl cis-trans isomerase [Anaeromyxobacter diazotrophicus]